MTLILVNNFLGKKNLNTSISSPAINHAQFIKKVFIKILLRQHLLTSEFRTNCKNDISSINTFTQKVTLKEQLQISKTLQSYYFENLTWFSFQQKS